MTDDERCPYCPHSLLERLGEVGAGRLNPLQLGSILVPLRGCLTERLLQSVALLPQCGGRVLERAHCSLRAL